MRRTLKKEGGLDRWHQMPLISIIGMPPVPKQTAVSEGYRSY